MTTVGLTASPFEPGQALPAEIKRLSTIAGGATSPDTIHVTISDTGADVYSVRGFGLYLDDGTLFASYGQVAVIVEKSAQAAMLIAVDIQFADVDATQLTFGDTNFSNAVATTEHVGVAEIATDAEVLAGTDASRIVTPRGLVAAFTARLGAGAPSTFIKTLLVKSNVSALVAALGIRDAAQYDTGAGNDLDADKLDGEHGDFYRAWENATGKPDLFPPSEHDHKLAEVIGLPERLRGRLLRVKVVERTGSYEKGDGTTQFRVRIWGGGGGGAGGGAYAAGWGGAGAGYAERFFLAPDGPVQVTIGQGGKGGDAGGLSQTDGGIAKSGGPGGTSSFGNFVSATGGGGGLAFLAPPISSVGGIGVGGDLDLIGSEGGAPLFDGGLEVAGSGGGSFGSQGAPISSGIGQRGGSPGAGGGGGGATKAMNSRGGDGGEGLCIIEEYA